MQNFVSKGKSINAILTAGVLGGDVILLGGLAGIANTAGDGVNLCAVSLEGVFTLPKAAGVSFTVGAPVYFVTADKNVTSSAAGNTLIGKAFSAAQNADAEVNVILTNGI